MIFSELYSAYYQSIAKIIDHILDGETDEKELQKIVDAYAFGESTMTVLPALKSGKWQLICPNMKTPLLHKPSIPLTNLQKRWLKAVSLDPRIRLFDVDFQALDDVEPLFTSEDYYIYDQYSDGDPYEDKSYIQRFRFLLSAIREQIPIKINVKNKHGQNVYGRCIPIRLEYSEKDDKFRLLTKGCRFMRTVNLSRIVSCSPFEFPYDISSPPEQKPYETLTLKITNERNALERVMLHFSHFEKQAEKTDEKHYTVRIRYDISDETELLIRVLSFGPTVQVIDSPRFINLIKSRLRKQQHLLP
ncbi:MAG: WYL domain-containing protein [Clostridia bacterium]|nr:WYL domain-containing protein [Clostridia bacterium]